MRKSIGSFFVFFVLLIASGQVQAQTTTQVTVFDSVSVTLDESVPGVNLITNDDHPLVGISLTAIKINNKSSVNIIVSGASLYCWGQQINRLDMTNIQVTKGETILGKINAWSLCNPGNILDFDLANPVVVYSHSSVIIGFKADLYGWGSYYLSLRGLTLTNMQTFEINMAAYNLDSKDIILANADHLELNMGVYPRGWNEPNDDTLYVLPGEYFYSSGYFFTSQSNYIEKAIIGFRTVSNISENLIGAKKINFTQPWLRNLDEIGRVGLDSTESSRTVTWTANSSLNGIDFNDCAWFSGYNNLPLGEIAHIDFYAEAIMYNQLSSKPTPQYISRYRNIVSIDGKLGDFNGDDKVTVDDPDAIQEIYTSHGGFMDSYAYVKDGFNIGRTAILFEGSSLLDILLIRIWTSNPLDPIVKGLGIGQLMSKRIRPTSVAYSQTISGNNIEVKTGAFAVRISTILPNGKLWSNSSLVAGGQTSFTVPDKSLQYKIEAVNLPSGATSVDGKINLPAEFKLNQNYPNPFNPTTTISYSVPSNSPVTLKIYDVLGKEIITLVNEEKTAGSYSVNFDASKLSSGIYIYKLNAGSCVQTKKMILMK